MPPSPRSSAPRELTAKRLAAWPLPEADEGGDKEKRGRVLVVGGAPQMAGAVILAATAALRAGAGKLEIATCASIALHVSAQVPEAYVTALPARKSGCLAPSAFEEIARRAEAAHAVLIGPGLVGEEVLARAARRLFAPLAKTDVTLVVDAAPLRCLAKMPDLLHPFGGRAIVTPHAGEMAMMSGLSKPSVCRAPVAIVRETAARWRAVVALKGAETFVTAPGADVYVNRAGNPGLGTSGSGDTLSGIVAGLVARGADPLQATSWGVCLHARAGDRLAARVGPLGFLARELLAEIPSVMAQLSRRRARKS